jgi:hypothetical protein
MFNIVNIKFISTLSFLWHKPYNFKLVRNFNKPIKSNEAAWCLNKPLNKSVKHCFVSIFNNGGHLASPFSHCHVIDFGAIARNARVVLAIVLYYPNTPGGWGSTRSHWQITKCKLLYILSNVRVYVLTMTPYRKFLN